MSLKVRVYVVKNQSSELTMILNSRVSGRNTLKDFLKSSHNTDLQETQSHNKTISNISDKTTLLRVHKIHCKIRPEKMVDIWSFQIEIKNIGFT